MERRDEIARIISNKVRPHTYQDGGGFTHYGLGLVGVDDAVNEILALLAPAAYAVREKSGLVSHETPFMKDNAASVSQVSDKLEAQDRQDGGDTTSSGAQDVLQRSAPTVSEASESSCPETVLAEFRLRRALDVLCGWAIGDNVTDVERAIVKGCVDDLDSILDRATLAESRLAEAVKALDPFAEAAMHLHPALPDDGDTLDGFKVREIRRAAEVFGRLGDAAGKEG